MEEAELLWTGGKGSCTFNFSKDKEIEELGDRLVAVAGTIVEGARLEALLQHDPLGLDKETEYLVEAAGDGRAQEIGAIRGILQRLADDEGVMDRVRKRARVLLGADGRAGWMTEDFEVTSWGNECLIDCGIGLCRDDEGVSERRVRCGAF